MPENTSEENLAALLQSLDESHNEAKQAGCVSREEVERTIREAIALGLQDRESDTRAAAKIVG